MPSRVMDLFSLHRIHSSQDLALPDVWSPLRLSKMPMGWSPALSPRETQELCSQPWGAGSLGWVLTVGWNKELRSQRQTELDSENRLSLGGLLATCWFCRWEPSSLPFLCSHPWRGHWAILLQMSPWLPAEAGPGPEKPQGPHHSCGAGGKGQESNSCRHRSQES